MVLVTFGAFLFKNNFDMVGFSMLPDKNIFRYVSKKEQASLLKDGEKYMQHVLIGNYLPLSPLSINSHGKKFIQQSLTQRNDICGFLYNLSAVQRYSFTICISYGFSYFWSLCYLKIILIFCVNYVAGQKFQVCEQKRLGVSFVGQEKSICSMF